MFLIHTGSMALYFYLILPNVLGAKRVGLTINVATKYLYSTKKAAIDNRIHADHDSLY